MYIHEILDAFHIQFILATTPLQTWILIGTPIRVRGVGLAKMLYLVDYSGWPFDLSLLPYYLDVQSLVLSPKSKVQIMVSSLKDSKSIQSVGSSTDKTF